MTVRAITAKRLFVAFALAPLGITTTVVLLTILIGMQEHADFAPDPMGLVVLAALTGLGYMAGAALLPVYFVLQRLGKGGWPFYVPIAAVAGGGTGGLMDWPAPFSRPVGFYIVCAVAGALSGGIFSVALAWRSKPKVGREGTPIPGRWTRVNFTIIGIVMALMVWEAWRLLLR